MQTKEKVQSRLNEINSQINSLREEGLRLVGKLELLEEQEKISNSVSEAIPTSSGI